jgi:hypothetical protein
MDGIWMNPVIVCHSYILRSKRTLTKKARRDLFKTGMRQAFLMGEAALAAIDNPPDPPGGSAKWVFPEQETRDMAARIFGTSFDVSFKRQDTNQSPTTNKFSVVRGTLHQQLPTPLV